MFEFLEGKLVSAVPPLVVVAVGGVGYRLLAPISLFSSAPERGESIRLYTSYVIRDNSHQLFGFPTHNDRDLFDQLTCVSGVGPKLALALVGHLSVAGIHQAVHQGDWSAIAQVPGIGKKTAERLIIEMRDRLVPIAGRSGEGPLIGDAVQALTNLGYTHQAARRAIDKALAKQSAFKDLGALITAALKEA